MIFTQIKVYIKMILSSLDLAWLALRQKAYLFSIKNHCTEYSKFIYDKSHPKTKKYENQFNSPGKENKK